MAHAGVPVSHGAEHGVGHVAVVEGGGVALGGGEHRHRQVGQVLVEADTWDSVLTCDAVLTRAANNLTVFLITEKDPTGAFSW